MKKICSTIFLAFTQDTVDTSTTLSHTLPTYWEKVLDINRKVDGRQKVAAEDHTSGSTDKGNSAN